MQGLAHYNDTPSPPASSSRRTEAGPSRPRQDVDRTGPPTSITPVKRPRRGTPPPPPSNGSNKPSANPSRAQSPPTSSHPVDRSESDPTYPPHRQGEENLLHTSQAHLPSSELPHEPVAEEKRHAQARQVDKYAGLSEDEVFALATRPDDIPGVEEWGIPHAVDTERCSPQLRAKVAQFLKLKYEKGQHINTSLLQSASFHNPHIYSKLVEFVDLDERRSYFPSGGWLTRLGIEGEVADHGPKRMAEEQRRRQEETKRGQEAGKRTAIAFQSGRKDRDEGAGVGGGREREREREERRERDGRRDRDRERRGDRQRDRDRDRQVERERPRQGDGKYRDTLGLARDRDGGWDERDMRKDKPKYRYY
ncbi:HCNGP-like protein-domain-containing protein [Papiliotrema laurentii]|uniref:HCNGP-like protein-domain-containing protein n=1 Tax=Papiliotrema laurentii TaxID=5418 RepID=A0AAD9FK92_PAPLA|nr:HCNGP-like protein-domain-containing protein [Papiliotrema laurentii]